MFTIKIANESGGYTAYQCSSYSVSFDKHEVNGEERTPYVSWWSEGDSLDVPALRIKHACYVENEAGKTVDVIRPRNVPHVEAHG